MGPPAAYLSLGATFRPAAIAAAWVPEAVDPRRLESQSAPLTYEYFDRKPKPWGVPRIDALNQAQPRAAYLHPDLLERRGVTDWADETAASGMASS